MKGDSTGGKRQVADSLRQTNSARERGPSLDTLDSLVRVRCAHCGNPIHIDHLAGVCKNPGGGEQWYCDDIECLLFIGLDVPNAEHEPRREAP